MTIEELLSGESKYVEYKVSRPEKSIRYMKTVVAFANGKGGCIVFGVDDETRNVVGVPKDQIFREMDAIANAISDSCEPVIIPDIYPRTVEDKTVIIVEISAGKQRPYYIKSEGVTDGVYMRVSGTSRKADRTMAQEMYYESEGRSYDSVIRRDLSISDEEIEKLCVEMKEVALENCKNDAQRQNVKDVTRNVLLSWGVLAEAEDGSIHPTNAYLFLTGQDFFLSKIQCGMFKGTTRAVFVDKRDYDGALWKQTEDAFQFVLRNIRLGAKIEGLYRQDIYELPPDSIRELIVNAVMNCSFLQPSHIQVAIYDDRLEITSPGGLMPGVTIDRMKEGYSQIRNRALAHAFSYMNLIEGWGTGIPRLFREMEEYGLQPPEFVDMEIALRVNLYRKPVNAEFVSDSDVHGKKMGSGEETNQETDQEISLKARTDQETEQETGLKTKTSQETDQEIASKAKIRQEIDGEKDTKQKILIEIMKNPSITQKQLGEKVNLSRSGIRYVMNQLREDGILERVGSTKKGQWIIKV